MSLKPLIAICGTTGVGKSNLAIQLVLHLTSTSYNGRWKGAKVINADSMQVYEGLDIITNKVPANEREGVEHLLMGFKKPGEQYVVGEWVHDALQLIENIHKENKIPIVVGGTSYWIQHLIFPHRLMSSGQGLVDPPSVTRKWSKQLAESIHCLPIELRTRFEVLPEEPPSAKTDPDGAFHLHTLLASLDPPMAQRWHWRDTRKVLRSLQIIKESRRPASEIIAEQGSRSECDVPRFRALCFWLYADPSTLGPRLNTRVDNMIQQGLLDEIRKLRKLAETLPKSDIEAGVYTLGIFQSIGYKEFSDYLSNTSIDDALFETAVEHMKLSTRQYAKRQVSWIRNKLLPAIHAANDNEPVVPMYLLDVTDLNRWHSNALDPATRLTEDFLCGFPLPEPSSLSETARSLLDVKKKDINPMAILNARRKLVCSACTIDKNRPVMIEEGNEWIIHEKTRSHRRFSAKKANGRESRIISSSDS
ncbi:tRNA isopentenyltransferase [Cyathus striatus]|nr:tRNA isopentenyltransferase [Cyathus striatus]